MGHEHFQQDFYPELLQPVRLHLVSGKTLDIRRPDLVMPLRDRVMVFRGLAKDGRSAEGYDIIALHKIERMERLDVSKPAPRQTKTHVILVAGLSTQRVHDESRRLSP